MRKKKITGLKESFYSLDGADILRQAKEMKIPKKRLTPEVMEKIKRKVKEETKEYVNDALQEAISGAVHEKEAAVK